VSALAKTVLQIVPRAPSRLNGVADYARTLARALGEQEIAATVFATQERETSDDSFPVVPLAETEKLSQKIDGLILHYVNYGFQKRGIPLWLPPRIKQLQRRFGVRLLVIFHELFASGPPWKSEFWLQPLQKKIARDLSQLADSHLVSSESMGITLRALTPAAAVRVQPVPSVFGEPAFDQARNPHRWVICGGTQLLERSLRSFLQLTIPEQSAWHELLLLGGEDNPAVRALVKANTKIEYYPHVSAEKASALLTSCSFAWLDYFTTANVRPDVFLKSSSFATLCAHGVICASPRENSGQSLPGPFTLHDLPIAEEGAEKSHAIYDWYHHHASIARLARAVAEELQLA